MSHPSTTEIGQQLVALCNAGKNLEAVDTLYDEKVESVEAAEAGGFPAVSEGVAAARAKNVWWVENHEVHASTAAGPFRGLRDDQFAVVFEVDTTFKPSGERQTMSELALYTVANGKVVREEFLSQVA